jgi:AbrB family looped-hinge helix DNA binding protein
MNAHTKIEHETLVNMTSKGQVLIPKRMREKRGLMPNGKVRVLEWTDGSITLEPVVAQPEETREQRKARIRAAIESVRGSIDLGGLTTDEFMRELRGDFEP